jgi:hypothetical protein
MEPFYYRDGHMNGDKRAIPFLTAPAVSSTVTSAVRMAAPRAISRLTERSFKIDEQGVAQVLTDLAWRINRDEIDLGGKPVAVWDWDNTRKVPLPQAVSTTKAEAILGRRFAKEALRHSPGDHSARAIDLSMTVEKAIKRISFTSFFVSENKRPSPLQRL